VGIDAGAAPNSATGTDPSAGSRLNRMYGPGTTSEVVRVQEAPE
jgi:hypothetical protein